MKTLLLLFTAVLLTTTASAQFYEAWPCKVKFKEKDLGMVKKGALEKIAFPFINDGTEPMVISTYKGGAENINVILPKKPVAAGASGKIIVEYNARTSGKFKEKIKVRIYKQKNPLFLKFPEW